jgi:hypothetical protein
MKNGLIIDDCGFKNYYKDDKLHREDGPAIESPSGYKEWRINDLISRYDGPAVEYPDGTKLWFLDGHLYDEDRYNEIMLEKKLKLLGF